MPLALPLPDGRFVTIREGETPEQTWARAQQMYPDAFAAKQAPEAPTTSGSGLGDIATAFKQGAVGSTKALTDVFGAQNAASASLGATSEALQKDYSPARQAELQAQAARMKEAEASGSTLEEIKAGAKNIFEAPVQSVAQGLGSLVPYVPTMFLGPLAGALRLARPTIAALESISAAAPKILGTAQGMGTVKGAVYDAVLQKETEAGVPPEVAKQKAESAQDYFGENADQIALGGVLGRVAGGSGIENLLTKPGAAAAAKGLTRRIATAAGTEAITEGPQGAQERLAANLAQQRAGYDVPTMQGVIGAGVQEGLTGALTAGPVAALRGPQATATKTQEQTDIEQARAEEEARLKKDREYKATPQYQQDVVEQYETLAQQKKDLVGQKKKIEKGSITEDADKSFNRDVELQLKTLQKQIDPLAKDYYQAKSFVTQQEKQAELAGMTPQEYMLQQMGAKPSATKVEPENDYVTMATQNKPTKVEPSAAQQYMQGQFQAAQGLVNDPGGYADYMMQDPQMAAQIVQNRLKVPGLSASENNLLLSGISLRLKEQEKVAQRAAKQELGQRQADLQAQKLTTPEDQMALFNQSTEDVEKLRAEGETNFDYLDPMFETALAGQPPVVQVSDAIKPTDKAPLIRKQVESLMEMADQADKDYQTARSANQPDAARKAFERGNQAIEQIKTVSKEGGDYAREFLSARQAQNNAMAQLGDITEQLRTGQTLGGPNKEMAASTEQSLTNKANQVRAQLVAATLQEAAIHRRAAGNPAITQDEAIKAASVVHDAVNDWVSRSAAKSTQPTYEDVIVQPAQMRADKIVRPAVTERRQVAPGTQAISPAETKHFQARVLAARNQLIAPQQILGRRIETGILKRQFSAEEVAKTAEARGETATTLSGELRRRTEYVRNKMAKMGAMRPAARDVLNAAADVMDAGKATRDILDTVEPVVDAIVSGRDVKQVDIRAIKDALAATKPTAVEQKAAGQAALFPETNEEFGYIRATAANFAKSPRMKPVWEALDKARALFKKTEAARAQRSATVRARTRELENLQSRIDNITKGAEFIAARQEKWSAEQLVNTFAAEKGKGLDQVERAALVKDALRTVSEGRRLDDLDNRLLGFMQDTNKEISDAAKVMYEKVAPLRDAVAAIKKAMKTSPTVTAEEKALLAHEDEIKKQRGEYQRATENAIKKAREDMDAARAVLLDPLIKQTSEALTKAETTLKKEKQELEKAKAGFEGLVEGSPQNRNQIRTYFLFKVEEKQGVIDDLTKQIEEQKDALEALVTQRYEEMDGAAAVAQAMLDKNVKTERTWLEMLEAQLAFVRGDDVLKKANSYPFAAERARISAKNQVQVVKAAEKRAEEFKAAAKTQQQEMEEFWQDKLGGEGITRTKGRKEKIVTKADKEAERLHNETIKQLDREEEAERRELVKDAQTNILAAQIADRLVELEAIPGSTDINELRKVLNSDTATEEEIVNAQSRIGILQEIKSLEAQEEVLSEGKPRKKQRPATALSSSALAKGKPLRTGMVQVLENASEALRSEKEYNAYDDTNISDTGLFTGKFDVLYRTTTRAGAGLKEKTIERIANTVTKGWAKVPDIDVVATEADLPQHIQDQAKRDKMTGKIPGLYDTQTKKVYLVAQNLFDENDVALTIAHEIAGHFGLREMLGGTYSKIMNYIYNGNADVKRAANSKMEGNKNLSREVAVEEVLAEIAEQGPQASKGFVAALRQVWYAIKQALAKHGIFKVSDNEVNQIVANARRYVQEGVGGKGGEAVVGDATYRSRDAKYSDPEFEDASKVTSRIVAQNRSWWDKIKANTTGLAFETQIVDRFAGFERLAKYLEPLKGTQMMFYLRQYDQRMNLVSDSVANGAPSLVEKTRKDGQIERMVESKDGASLSGVVTTLKDAKQYIGNGEAVNQMFTTYLAAIRAANKGIDSLNFGTDKDGKPILTQADLDKITNLVEKNKPLKDIFEKARSEYNEYNRNLIKFLVDTGALDQVTANRLVREDDYIPFYRQRGGVAELLIGSESPIYIGSIKEQPYLQELVGGDQPILDFMTSSVQNTNLLLDMGLRNLATKNAVMELVDLKAATLVKKASGPDVVKFKIDGSERYAIMHTEKVKIGNKEFDTGVPADILVKGMEGIPTQMPFLLRAMAMPSQLLRKGIVVSPLYIGKQLFRDSLAAPIISGADFLPVIGVLKELRGPAKRTLEKRGIVGGQQFRGTSEDLSMILRDMADDKPGWMFALGKLEAAGMEADALTRRAQYNSYIEQGLSEMEATLMALESMNFNKRGASPSIHVANALIPFFNAQIQGLNVMYKAMTGNMPFNDKLRIREKMLQRGALMAGITLAYAAHMEDDEAYKNATPDQKYGSWFVRVPGVDEPVRVPLPFEIGYVFKAIPEALYNSMTTEHGGEEAVKAFKQILLQTVPGGTSYGIPQFFKPAIEVGLGKSFYTGRDILSAREQRELPEQQYRNNTTEAAKYVGSSLGISPIKLEALISGYTGTLGLAFMQAISLGVPVGESPEKAVKRLSEYPIVGGLFQPNDAGGIINAVYERMNEAEQVRTTVRSLMKDGKITEANALLERRGNEYMQAEISDVFKSNMSKLTQAERAINASDMSPQEKRAQLDEIRKMKIGLANAVREISDKTIHLTGFP